MGMFTNTQAKMASGTYVSMKEYLKPKDGLIHVVLIHSFSKFANQNFECDNKYTTQIDLILTEMQNDGYEIIDVKLNTLTSQGVLGDSEKLNTLIAYK